MRRDDYIVRRTTTDEPQVIQQNQRIEQKSVLMERRDPALNLLLTLRRCQAMKTQGDKTISPAGEMRRKSVAIVFAPAKS